MFPDGEEAMLKTGEIGQFDLRQIGRWPGVFLQPAPDEADY